MWSPVSLLTVAESLPVLMAVHVAFDWLQSNPYFLSSFAKVLQVVGRKLVFLFSSHCDGSDCSPVCSRVTVMAVFALRCVLCVLIVQLSNVLLCQWFRSVT